MSISKVQDRKEDVLNVTRRYIKVASYIIFPMMLGFFAVAEVFVSVEEEVWKHECISLDYDEEQVITDFSNLHESAIKKFCEIRGCKLL